MRSFAATIGAVSPSRPTPELVVPVSRNGVPWAASTEDWVADAGRYGATDEGVASSPSRCRLDDDHWVIAMLAGG
jgi:hypothetical protein